MNATVASAGLQITFDCAGPHALVRFWAAALGMVVEDHDELVAGLLDAGELSDDDVVLVDGRGPSPRPRPASPPTGDIPACCS